MVAARPEVFGRGIEEDVTRFQEAIGQYSRKACLPFALAVVQEVAAAAAEGSVDSKPNTYARVGVVAAR